MTKSNAPITITKAQKGRLTMIGDRLRSIREQKKLSQGDVQKKTGLLRCYISRVENGHTVPAVATLEKLARAFDIPLYQSFYEDEQSPASFVIAPDNAGRNDWGSSRKGARFLHRFPKLLAKMSERDRRILIGFAHRTTLRKRRSRKSPKPRYSDKATACQI
jgi:transcriptional regulator with XRE-family HTH domain